MRHGMHLVGSQRVVLRLWERRLRKRSTKVGAVSCLDGEDAPSSRQVRFVGHLSGRAEVGGGADSLEDAGGGDELGDAGDAEGVGALLDGREAGCLQRRGEELDVGRLVRADGLHVLVEGGVEAGAGELRLREVGQAFAVELVLQMFQGEGIAEYIDCDRSGSILHSSHYAWTYHHSCPTPPVFCQIAMSD